MCLDNVQPLKVLEKFNYNISKTNTKEIDIKLVTFYDLQWYYEFMFFFMTDLTLANVSNHSKIRLRTNRLSNHGSKKDS